MGPERLPEVARQAAFLIRKARQGMFRIRNEMRSELEGTPFEDLENAKREMSDLKNDIKQFGRDLADSADQTIDEGSSADAEKVKSKGVASRPSFEHAEQEPTDAGDNTEKSSTSDEA